MTGLQLKIANRTPEKAEILAKRFGGETISFEDLGNLDSARLKVCHLCILLK